MNDKDLEMAAQDAARTTEDELRRKYTSGEKCAIPAPNGAIAGQIEGQSRHATTLCDRFLCDVWNHEIDVTPELAAILLQRAREYIRLTGGLPPWSDWIMYGEATRKAFEDALKEIQLREMSRIQEPAP